MTVGTPSVEGEHGTQHTKTYKDKGEPDALLTELNECGTPRMRGNVEQVESLTAGTIEDTEKTLHHESRCSDQHQGQFHG